MAQSQLLVLKNKAGISKFDTVDITVNESMTISICGEVIKIRQKDMTGRSKSSIFSKDNWFELMNFVQIINSFFLLKYEKNNEDEDSDSDTPNSKHIIESHDKHYSHSLHHEGKSGKHIKNKISKKNCSHKL